MWLEKQILAGGDLSPLWKVVFKGASQENWAGVSVSCICAMQGYQRHTQSSLAGTLWGGEKWFFPSCILCIFWILVQLSLGPSCLFHCPCRLEVPRLIAPGFYKPAMPSFLSTQFPSRHSRQRWRPAPDAPNQDGTNMSQDASA